MASMKIDISEVVNGATEKIKQEGYMVQKWIPCSEMLPVLYVPVMILTDDGSYAIAHVTENEDEYLWVGDGGHYSKDYVLFWMTLPEPPKTGKDGKE